MLKFKSLSLLGTVSLLLSTTTFPLIVIAETTQFSNLPENEQSEKQVGESLNNEPAIFTQTKLADDTSLDSWLPDKELQAAVASAMGIKVSDITKDKIANLTGLNASFKNISDLTGLEHAVSLIRLKVDSNNISNIEPLRNLTNLYEVYLSQNPIDNIDLSVLYNSKASLKKLILAKVRISDLSVLSNFPKLTNIHLGYSDYTDNDFKAIDFKDFPDLNDLNITSNHLEDMSFITDLPPMEAINATNQTLTNEVIKPSGDFFQYNNIKNITFTSSKSLEGTEITEIINGSTITIRNLKELGNSDFKIDVTGKLDGRTYANYSATIDLPYERQVVARDITVRYVDQTGVEIHSPQTLSGNIGETYDATTDIYKLAIGGYTLDQTKMPSNATGTFSNDAQTVTYVYTKDPVPASDVTVRYVDQTGTEIHSPQTLSGNIDETYDATTDTYKLAIDGYTLDQTKMPSNATGIFSNDAQTVTYVYTKNSVPASDVTVRYVDQTGVEIHSAQTLSGNIDEAFDTTTDTYKLAIDGYTLDQTKMPSNATGTFSNDAQTVTYIYTKNPVPARDVTVRYVDQTGTEIHNAQTLSGNIGETYDTTTDTYKLAIDGYTLDQIKMPSNATGIFSEDAQTVTYVYIQNPILAKIVTIHYVDQSGIEIHNPQTLLGNTHESYDTTLEVYRLAIDGYTLDETKIPSNAIGIFSNDAQTVTYVYKKNNSHAPNDDVLPLLQTRQNNLVAHEVWEIDAENFQISLFDLKKIDTVDKLNASILSASNAKIVNNNKEVVVTGRDLSVDTTNLTK